MEIVWVVVAIFVALMVVEGFAMNRPTNLREEDWPV